MENYYELLDLREQDDRETIENELKKLNKTYRQRANHKDAKIRNEATERVNLAARAMVKFRSDDDRAAYDRELNEAKSQKQLQEPLIDIDFYAFLGLPILASVEEIQNKLNQLERNLGTLSNGNNSATREQQLISDARNILLALERRKKYDEQVTAKRNFERHRDREKPVPIIVGDVEIYDWISLEKILDQYPDEGLFLLQDGEIEAWLKWSLGQKQRSAWTREIASRSLRSDTPFLEFEEFQRLINPNRSFVLYEQGGHPRQGIPIRLHQIADIPKLADSNWSIFRLRLDYILDWMAEISDQDVLKGYLAIPASENADIQLERLLYSIDPQLPTPQVSLQGVSDQTIDFGLLSKWERAEREIEIIQSGRGYLYGMVKTSAGWLKMSTTHFGGRKSALSIEVIPSKLIAEQDNQCQLTFSFLDGRLPPISVNIIVRQRTTWQSVTNVFNRETKSVGEDQSRSISIDDTQPRVLVKPKSRLGIIAVVMLLLAIGAVFVFTSQNGSINLAVPAVIQGWERFESADVAIQMPSKYGYFSFEENLGNVLNQMSSMGSQFEQIAEAVRQNPSLFVLWLYDEEKYGTASMSSVLVAREPLQQSVTLDQYLDAIENLYNSSQFEIASRSIVSVGRYNAGRMVVITTVVGNIQVTAITYIIISNGSVWSVTYGVNSNDFEENIVIYDQSIRTLELP